MTKAFLEPPFAPEWTPQNFFDKAFALEGEVFRKIKNRKTLRFVFNEKYYFIKIHHGTGWREILKNIFQFKRPVLGARNEFQAIRLLEKLRIPTMHARVYGERGSNPATMESFLITDELTGKTTLEDLTRNWKKNPPAYSEKFKLIRALAETCAKMHFAGLNHRDCYLCHFLLDNQQWKQGIVSLTVLDLHRAEIRNMIPRRMRVKDLAGIFFSSMDAGLSRRDAFRFIAIYSSFGKLDSRLWRDVLQTAVKLYRKEWERLPELPNV